MQTDAKSKMMEIKKKSPNVLHFRRKTNFIKLFQIEEWGRKRVRVKWRKRKKKLFVAKCICNNFTSSKSCHQREKPIFYTVVLVSFCLVTFCTCSGSKCIKYSTHPPMPKHFQHFSVYIFYFLSRLSRSISLSLFLMIPVCHNRRTHTLCSVLCFLLSLSLSFNLSCWSIFVYPLWGCFYLSNRN